jgi:amino acid transporter
MIKTYLRQSSGLVRTVNSTQVFIYNVSCINIAIGVAYIILYGPSFYFGSNMWMSTLICALLCIPHALSYYFFSVMMPRTGGEYVYISRTLFPALGLAMSVTMVIWNLFYSGWSAAIFAQLGLAPIFSDLSTSLNNPALMGVSEWIQGSMGSFIIGTVMIVFSAGLITWGMDKFFKVHGWAMIIAMVGIVAMIVVLAATTREEFIARFNQFAPGIEGPNKYENVINIAKSSGWENPGFNWNQTLRLMVWPFLAVGFSIWYASFAGEIKKVERSVLIGNPGSLLFTTAFFIVLLVLSEKVMGYDFLGAIGWNTYMAPEGATPTTPWVQYLITMMTDNLILKLLIGIGFLMWTYFWISAILVMATRGMFAWAFDRLLPKSIGNVSGRFHSPVNAIIVSAVIAEIFLYLYLFTGLLTALVGIMAMAFTFFFVGISAMIVPFRLKEVFESSPVNYRIFGIPLISILGFLAAAFMALLIYFFFTDDTAGANTPTSLFAVFAPMVIGFIYYYVAKWYRNRQDGINIADSFTEIPVE